MYAISIGLVFLHKPSSVWYMERLNQSMFENM